MPKLGMEPVRRAETINAEDIEGISALIGYAKKCIQQRGWMKRGQHMPCWL